MPTQIANFMGPIWGPPGSCRPHKGPMLAPRTCYQGTYCHVDPEEQNLFESKTHAFVQENAFENVVYEISAILFG